MYLCHSSAVGSISSRINALAAARGRMLFCLVLLPIYHAFAVTIPRACYSSTCIHHLLCLCLQHPSMPSAGKTAGLRGWWGVGRRGFAVGGGQGGGELRLWLTLPFLEYLCRVSGRRKRRRGRGETRGGCTEGGRRGRRCSGSCMGNTKFPVSCFPYGSSSLCLLSCLCLYGAYPTSSAASLPTLLSPPTTFTQALFVFCLSTLVCLMPQHVGCSSLGPSCAWVSALRAEILDCHEEKAGEEGRGRRRGARGGRRRREGIDGGAIPRCLHSTPFFLPCPLAALRALLPFLPLLFCSPRLAVSLSLLYRHITLWKMRRVTAATAGRRNEGREGRDGVNAAAE